MTLRDYLLSNMFDGDDGGSVTQQIGPLLDEVCELVALWLVQQTGAEDAVESYYGASPQSPSRTLLASER